MPAETGESEAPDRPVDAIVREFEQKRPHYERLGAHIRDQLNVKIQGEGLTVESITHRTKSLDGFREKMRRPGKTYVDPLHEITDLAGVRVMTYFKSDGGVVGKVIRNLYTVDEDNSTDFEAAASPDVFGYQSVHYVVSLKEPDLPKKELAGLKCEIQVRTLLQHAWAETTHGRLYKPPYVPARSIERRFFALAGLLEIADHEFEYLRDRETQVKADLRERIEAGDLAIDIDIISLPIYLTARDLRTQKGEPISGRIVYELVDEARAVGLGSLGELEDVLGRFTVGKWQQLCAEMGISKRSGIGYLRDSLKFKDAQAYYEYVRVARKDWDLPFVRGMCDKIAGIRSTGGMGRKDGNS